MVVEQLGGSVLEGLGQRPQQHGELGGVQLKQRDQHHLGSLQGTAGHTGHRGHREGMVSVGVCTVTVRLLYCLDG